MNRKFVQNQTNSKSRLRKMMLTKRQVLEKNFVGQASRIITQSVLGEIKKLAPANILVYLAFANEVDTVELVRQLPAGTRVIVPKYFERTGKYQLVSLENLADLEEGAFGILQPRSSRVVDPKLVDVAIIPGVAFDKRGVRLGYGKGVFDRLLANSKAYKIGLAYDFQIVRRLTREQHDLVMDKVVTESRVI